MIMKKYLTDTETLAKVRLTFSQSDSDNLPSHSTRFTYLRSSFMAQR